MPATTSPTLPLPSQTSTRTATSAAPLATPTVRPTATAPTCVPWPSQSGAPAAPPGRAVRSRLRIHKKINLGFAC